MQEDRTDMFVQDYRDDKENPQAKKDPAHPAKFCLLILCGQRHLGSGAGAAGAADPGQGRMGTAEMLFLGEPSMMRSL